MVKDVFGYSHIKLTGTDGSSIYITASNVEGLLGTDYGCEVLIIKSGCMRSVFCKETPEEVIEMINNLAAYQEQEHRRMEKEARDEAQERFFDKHPAAKEALLKEAEEKKTEE